MEIIAHERKLMDTSRQGLNTDEVSVDMIRALPALRLSQSEKGHDFRVVEWDGFSSSIGTIQVMRAPSLNGTKGPNIQGPLLGVVEGCGCMTRRKRSNSKRANTPPPKKQRKNKSVGHVE